MLTKQVLGALMKILSPQGVAVIIEASHMCMMMRGLQKQSTTTVTSSMLGVFRDCPTTRQKLLSLLNGRMQG